MKLPNLNSTSFVIDPSININESDLPYLEITKNMTNFAQFERTIQIQTHKNENSKNFYRKRRYGT